MYSMQGACDPRAMNSSDQGYYPNCTTDNNNVVTGGVVAPNPTNLQVYRKAADLSPFLKALHESYPDVKQMGYFFSNSGAGSSVFYPHYALDPAGSYESVGCEWMRALNPINETLGAIATEEEISRCHPEGAIVPMKEYNPLERAWCRDQALNPQRVHNIGPYIDAFNNDQWIMTAGRAVYDRITGAFISCIAVEFLIDAVKKILESVKVDDLGVIFTLARNDDDGTVVISRTLDWDAENSTTTVDDPSIETGIDRDAFDKIKSIVDFSQKWDPKDVSDSFAKSLFAEGEYVVSAYPIPLPPDKYDPTYVPEFFAIFSLPLSESLEAAAVSVNNQVDKNVSSIVIISVAVGLVGLAVVILLIFATSSWFVEPLKWIHNVGDQVVGKFGQDLDTGIDYERKKSLPCSPNTELRLLVDEFKVMVARFSGEGTAKRMALNDIEKVNSFDLSADFLGLYKSRDESVFKFNYSKSAASKDQSVDQCHLGPNIVRISPTLVPKAPALGAKSKGGKIYRSPLFLWMVGSIVTPTLIITVIISAVTLWKISNDLPLLVSPVRDKYFNLMELQRFTKTEILALRASEVAEQAARDTYLLTRFASWLLFGGMSASGSFTEIIHGKAEECKTAPSRSGCEYERDMPCDCAWNDYYARGTDTCAVFPSGSRHLQKLSFDGQSQDVGPDGSRYSTSFPKLASSPDTTAWWHNISSLPGSSEGSLGSNYDTTYERVLFMSALSTVIFPLYNYDQSDDKTLAFYVGFEADGMLAGFNGCRYDAARLPFWKSTIENGGAVIRNGTLCPGGKYGYDARCRGWYDDGKAKAEAGNGTLHITLPYLFAGGEVVGQSATSPLIDPISEDKHIGQVLVDYLPNSIFKSLDDDYIKLTDGGFPLMITKEHVIVGPGYSLAEGVQPIEDFFSDDADVRAILKEMTAGNGDKIREDSVAFFGIIEDINIAYAPVYIRNYRPLNSSNIWSGVSSERIFLYSLALVETNKGLLKPFESIDEFLNHTVDICIGVLSALIVISTMLIIFIAFRVTRSMTGPILDLLDVMKDINSMRITNDDISKLSNYSGSCLEVDSVYQTIEVLYQVVEFANSAFFSGEFEIAYQVLVDALRLFTRLDNKKAIAVASNNLGNTMLSVYRTMKASGYDEMCGLSKTDVVAKGTAYFCHAIKLGEEAYDDFFNKQGWSEECLVFMQHLANRYFNRAIFFLTTSCDNDRRKEVESLGFRDLQIAADMDVEIVDQCLEMGFKINRVERYDLMMIRVRGLLALVEAGYTPEELSVEDQINDVYNDLMKAMKNPSQHELFKNVTFAARMQKFDTELIKYFSLAKNDTTNAARVAIRMLIEDEYIFPDAEQEAIKALLVYVNAAEDENCPNGDIVEELESVLETLKDKSLQRMERSITETFRSSSLGIRTSLNFSTSRSHVSSTRSIGGKEEYQFAEQKPEILYSSIKQCCRGDITMELF